MVSVTHLRAFHFVALARGYSQAAREMAVSQSTLSAQVRQLEASSGTVLFKRGPRGASLTNEGEALFAITAHLFQALSDAATLLKNSPVEGGHLRLAVDGTTHTLPILKALRQKRSNLTFAIQLHNSDVVIDHVLNYRADIGISAHPPEDQRLSVQPLISMRLGVIIPITHEWAQRACVSLQELEGQDLVQREAGSRTRAIFEKNMSGHSNFRGSNIEVSSSEAVRETVVAGFGIGIIADFDFRPDPRLHFVPISNADQLINEYVVCLKEKRRLPMIDDFFKVAEHIFSDHLAQPA